MTAQRMPPLNGELRCFVHPSLFESDRDLRSRFIGDLVGQVGVVVECTPEAPFRFIFYDPAGPPLRNLTKPAVSYHWLDACIKAGRRVDFGPFLAPRNPFSSLPTPRISDHRRSVLTGPSQRIMDTPPASQSRVASTSRGKTAQNAIDLTLSDDEGPASSWPVAFAKPQQGSIMRPASKSAFFSPVRVPRRFPVKSERPAIVSDVRTKGALVVASGRLPPAEQSIPRPPNVRLGSDGRVLMQSNPDLAAWFLQYTTWALARDPMRALHRLSIDVAKMVPELNGTKFQNWVTTVPGPITADIRAQLALSHTQDTTGVERGLVDELVAAYVREHLATDPGSSQNSRRPVARAAPHTPANDLQRFLADIENEDEEGPLVMKQEPAASSKPALPKTFASRQRSPTVIVISSDSDSSDNHVRGKQPVRGPERPYIKVERERARSREFGTRFSLPRPGSRWVESEPETEEHKFLSEEAVHWMHDRVDHSGEAAATKHKYHYQDDEDEDEDESYHSGDDDGNSHSHDDDDDDGDSHGDDDESSSDCRKPTRRSRVTRSTPTAPSVRQTRRRHTKGRAPSRYPRRAAHGAHGESPPPDDDDDACNYSEYQFMPVHHVYKHHVEAPRRPGPDIDILEEPHPWHVWFLNFLDWALQRKPWLKKSGVFKAMADATGEYSLEFAAIAYRLGPQVATAFKRARRMARATRRVVYDSSEDMQCRDLEQEDDGEDDEEDHFMHKYQICFDTGRVTVPEPALDAEDELSEAHDGEATLVVASQELDSDNEALRPTPSPSSKYNARGRMKHQAESEDSVPSLTAMDVDCTMTDEHIGMMARTMKRVEQTDSAEMYHVWRWMRIALRERTEREWEMAYNSHKLQVDEAVAALLPGGW